MTDEGLPGRRTARSPSSRSATRRRSPWGDLGVDVVIESTGRFTSREAAMRPSRSRSEACDHLGAEQERRCHLCHRRERRHLRPERHFVVSNASCTTNCLVPMVKVLDDAFGIRQGLMTTVHAYTNDQSVLDLGRDNLRRARAAAVNIIPSTTGAARATSLVLEAMKGRLDGQSLRVPVPGRIDHRPHGRCSTPASERRRSTRPSGPPRRPSALRGSSSTTRTRSSRPTSSAAPRRALSTRR